MEYKITINGHPSRLELTDEQVKELQAQFGSDTAPHPPKKFEWDYPFRETFLVGMDRIHMRTSGIDPNNLLNGRYRLTMKAAEQSFLRNARANRLEALAEQLGGLKEFEYKKENWWIKREHDKGIWTIYYSDYASSPERVYMTKKCAEEICRMLNAGEFEL